MVGYRTYTVAGAMAIVSALFGLGVIERSLYEMLMGLLTSGGFMALRSGVTTETHAAAEEVKATVVNAPPPLPPRDPVTGQFR